MRRILLIGCGDIALRTAGLVRGKYLLYGLSHRPEHSLLLRAHGILPIPGDLDDPSTLGRIAGLGHIVLHFAPPQNRGDHDQRTANLLSALTKSHMLPYRLVYISTTGVYGDCQGQWVAETHPVNPRTSRARRRADAERRIRAWGRRNRVAVMLLRAPGIYAENRLPVARIQARTPAIVPEEDSYTNHIHGDDLARIVVAAMENGRPGRVYNANDDTQMKMGDYFDLVADSLGLERPPRVSRGVARASLPEALLSFMGESRRLINGRMKSELRVNLHYPTVHTGVMAGVHSIRHPATGVKSDDR